VGFTEPIRFSSRGWMESMTVQMDLCIILAVIDFFLPEIDGFIRSWGMFLRLKPGGISAEPDEVRCRWELK
jgi:hypothetical protein